MEYTIPRVVIAGTGSGCGKTTVTCALLQALVNRGNRVGAFKCGPDYIDPMFHSRIIGAESRNLDPFFFDGETLRRLLAKNGKSRDISVIEGVMGFYDGLSPDSPRGSTWDVARITGSPTVLVVGARGASVSILAVIQGFLTLFPDNPIRGVILNQCAAGPYPALAKAIRERFGLRPLGYLPRMPECALESRHLGLVTAAEVTDLREKLALLAAQAERSIDLDGLTELAREAPPVRCCDAPLPRFSEPVWIAVARDKAFCFYYEDSLDILRQLGAQLVPFSPLTEEALPPDIQGIYLGGGYPELYARQLGENTSMEASLKQALEREVPCIAECGGFMYLTQAIGECPAVGFLPGRCFDTGKLTRFGYVRLRAKQDNLLCPAGQQIPAHEFHHWDCTCPGEAFTAEKPSGKRWDCAVATRRLYAGFPHFHFASDPSLAVRFYEACLEEKHSHE